MDYYLYTLLAPATLIILMITLALAWRYRTNPQAGILLVALSENIGWIILNYLELVFVDPSAKVIFAKSSYLFNGSICVVWLSFALRYTGLERFITRRRVALVLLPWVVAVILILTNEWHGLIWQSFDIIDVAGFNLTAVRIFKYGALFWPLTFYYWCLVLGGFVLLLRKFLRSSPLFRRQTSWILVGATLPLALNLIYVLRLIPNFNKDYTPVAFGLSTLLLAVSILRFHLFELAPVARETLVDQMGDGMLVLDSEQRVVDNNPAAERLLDRPMQLVGFNLGQLFPDLPNFSERLPRQANLPVELQYQSHAGRTLKLRIWGLTGNNIRASGWLLILEDVSAAQRALSELRKSEELFRSVVQSAQEGVAVINLQGQITYASPRMLEMFGFGSSHELIGKPVYEFIVPADVPRAAANLQRLITGQSFDETIYQHRRKNGSTFFSESLGALLRGQDGTPYGIVLLARDITARLASDSERARMAQILQTVIDNEQIILTSTNRDQKMVLWNKGAEMITGFSATEALNNPTLLERTYPDPVYRQQMDELRQRVRDGEAVNMQIELTSRNGEKKYVAMFSRSLRDEQGLSIGTVNVGLDITPRIQAEQTMQTLNNDLEELMTQRTNELQETVHRLEEEILARRQAETELVATQENLANRLAEQSRQLAALYEVIITGGQSLEWQVLLDDLLEKILTVTGGKAGAIYQNDPEGPVLHLLAQLGVPEKLHSYLLTMPKEWNAQTPSPRISGLESCLTAPIHLRGEITGAMRIWRRKSSYFSIEDIALSNALADQVGIIIENARLRTLIKMTAVEEERRRLARDLHDSVTQSLHSLTWLADVALNRLKQGNTEKLEQSLHQITQSSRQALKEMRLLLYESLAQITGKLPLVEALTLRLEAVEQRAGLQTKLEIDDEREWPIEWEAELFAITIEALNNALKHARANQVNIRLRGGETWCDLEIEDDGIGFDPDHIPGGGMGLRNIRERAATLGGSLEINSTLKKGTRIRVKIGQIHPEPTAETGEPK